MSRRSPSFGHFGRFQLLEQAGSGFMGTVYRAHDPERDAPVALKLIPLDHADQEALELERNGTVLQQRLSREARQVAEVHEYGDLDGYFYVVMEYVEGQDLAHALARAEGPLAVDRAVWIAYQLCEMLEIAHGFTTEIDGKACTAILHGDLKPENIRLQEGDRVRILDFGASKVLSGSKVTRNVLGTTLYLAPERLRSTQVNEQSDLWAVGIILYQMVAGYVPYTGSSHLEVEERILSGPPMPLPPGCPEALKTILQRCLAVDPERRYASARELKADLESFQAGETPVAATLRAQPAPETLAQETPDTQATRRVRGPGEPPPPPPKLPPLPSDPALSDRPAPRAPAPHDSAQPQGTRTVRGLRSRVVFLLAFLVLILAISQLYAHSAGAEIVRQIDTTSTPDLEEAWEDYQWARRFAVLDLGLRKPRNKLRTSMRAAADRVLTGYRRGGPTTRQGDWRRARDYLRNAIELGDNSPETRARMLYAAAHVDRIEAASLRSQGKREEAERKWNDALFDFRRAAELAPGWPDPFLGLARVYAYDRFDLEELTDALGEAAKRGYTLQDREVAQLADGHLTEGKQLYNQARALDGEGARRTQRRLFRRARYHLGRASQEYQDILYFGRARQNRAEALRLLDRIEDR